MNLASVGWQVAMDPEFADPTAFVSAEGLFQFKVMPFGLTNAPATFKTLDGDSSCWSSFDNMIYNIDLQYTVN